MILSNYNVPSIAFGIGTGVVAIHIINSKTTEKAINRVERIANAVYNSLTYENVTTFTITCMGLSLACSFAIPAIKNIFKQLESE